MPRRPAPVKPETKSRLTPQQEGRLGYLCRFPEKATKRELLELADAYIGLGGPIPDELILSKDQLDRIAKHEGVGILTPQSFANLGFDMPVQPRRPGKRPFRLATDGAPAPLPPKRGRPPKPKQPPEAAPEPNPTTLSFRIIDRRARTLQQDAS